MGAVATRPTTATARPYERSETGDDWLVPFAPFLALAALFSIAGDADGLSGANGLGYAAQAWAITLASCTVIVDPRRTLPLLLLAGITTLLYLVRLPVASNNKTISFVFALGLLASAAVLYPRHRHLGVAFRNELYEHVRVVARLLLATMYFYGIFHKINADFFDPEVSCAVGLYRPLAAPFGLDDNPVGRYLAIWSTFAVEAIAIVGLFWRRWFAVGLIASLAFHYVIPISAYSWYMDFSSLVFALYLLSMPREASSQLYRIVREHAVEPLCSRFGRLGLLLPLAGLLMVLLFVVAGLSQVYPGRGGMLLLHSVFMALWAIVGGAAMVGMVWATVQFAPYYGKSEPRHPNWLWVIPGIYFVSCLSPYVGLKTESSINMFSNLHTEGGQTNHLLFARPPYLFSYQDELVRVVDASNPQMVQSGRSGLWNVKFSIDEYLRRNPQAWVSYQRADGTVARMVDARSLETAPASWLERKLLVFKQVDLARPKVCTH